MSHLPTIIGLIGFIGTGKNTAAGFFSQQGYVTDSFASSLKDVCASMFGWPRHLLEGDTPESRQFRETVDPFWAEKLGRPEFTPRLGLQLIGTDVMRDHFHSDIWLNTVEYRALRRTTGSVMSDCRFANEVGLIKRMGGIVVHVRRGELPGWYSVARFAASGNASATTLMKTHYPQAHYSEWAWLNTEPDFVIYNDGTLADLEQEVSKIMSTFVTDEVRG